ITLWSIGPRQIIGLSPGFSRPMEIIFRPCDCTGMMRLSCVACGSCSVPSMMGTFGPYTSASSNPTLLKVAAEPTLLEATAEPSLLEVTAEPSTWPSFASASARLTATVVLPTPPLPLAMATRFFTPGMGWRAGVCCGTGTGGIWIPILQLAEMGRSMLRPYEESSTTLGRGAVVFFVFFAGAAGTGIVAADFGASTHGLRRFGLRGAGLILQIFLLALLAALDLPGDFREPLRLTGCGARRGAGYGGLRASGAWWRATTAGRLRPKLHFVGMLFRLLPLNLVEVADGFVIDAGHHVFKEHEGFFLELDERIFLAVAAQADAFLEVVEGEQVVFPLGIDDVENDAALEPAHQLGTELLFFFLVALGDGFDRGFGELVVAERAGIGASGFGVNAKLTVHLGEKLRGIPLIGMLLAGAEGVNEFARAVFADPHASTALVFTS